MKPYCLLPFVVCLLAAAVPVCADEPLTTARVMADLGESDWREPDPANLMILRLPHGEVIIELAPSFAPRTVANIKTLVTEKYFDGLAIIRSQDNYVVQWGDPAEDKADARSLGTAATTLKTEFVRNSADIDIATIDSRDAYADVVGFAGGFPAASDGKRTWLTHCYGMLGVARGMDPESGNGSSLYVVTGHAPRHLDRNLTVAGRVLSGIENLTSLPRGTGQLGFYENADELVKIKNVRMGNTIPEKEFGDIEVMGTDTPAFSNYVKSRMYRHEEFFVDPTGRIEICNINPPVRISKP